MNVSDMYGSFIQPSKRWLGGFTELSNPTVGQTPPEELRVDPYLPAQFADPYDPAGGIAIPAGRFVALGFSSTVTNGSYDAAGSAATVSAYRVPQAERGKTPLTLHDGLNLVPVGLSVNNIFRGTAQEANGNTNQSGAFYESGNTFGTDSAMSATDVKFRRGFFAAVPYVLQINNAHGALVGGDSLTGYWGSTSSASAIGWIHRGKPVKWTSKQLKAQSVANATSVVLTEAIYPGMTPRIVSAFTANGTGMITGTLPTVAAGTITFSGTNWVAVFPQAVGQVLYEYGQDSDQRMGEVVRIQSLADTKSREELFKFVEVARKDYLNYPPPATQRVNVVVRNQEVCTQIVAGRTYRILNAPLSVNHNVLVEVQGTVVDPSTGVSVTYSGSNWFPLPAGPSLSVTAGLVGAYHSINWKTGVIELASNVTATNSTSVRVTYSSVADPRVGAVIWGGGIEGLTDGRYLNSPPGSAGSLVPANRAGVPAHLNFADVVGELRFLVRN